MCRGVQLETMKKYGKRKRNIEKQLEKERRKKKTLQENSESRRNTPFKRVFRMGTENW